jgi:preprotein translocase subunit SecG
MSAIFIILIVIGCIGLILFVLVQNPKGGGLNSEFGSAVQLGGAKRATDILEKGTWGLALLLAVVCLAMASPGKGDGVSTEIEADPDSVEQFEQPGVDNELPPVGPIGPGL